jgi:hypothetical protein
MAVFWAVVSCRTVRVYQRFGGPYCLYHQGHDVQQPRTQDPTIQKTAILELIAVRTSNLL